MSFPKKHIYQEDSPGAAREKAKTTLTQIKSEIERDPAMRREYRKRGLLANGRSLKPLTNEPRPAKSAPSKEDVPNNQHTDPTNKTQTQNAIHDSFGAHGVRME